MKEVLEDPEFKARFIGDPDSPVSDVVQTLTGPVIEELFNFFKVRQ